MKQKKILVGLSGGVDSAVTAYLLQQQGHEVTAGFMINYITEEENCTTKQDLDVAREVADYLGIQLFTFDFIDEYKTRILDYIYAGYESGITPNPDVFCNSRIKFDIFREEALSIGFDAIATGHYARVSQDKDGFHLLAGLDPDKDQSYFLSTLNQEQLSTALFPIGELHKSKVREIAQEAGLPNATRKDSQGLCFVGKVDFADFLKKRIQEKPGNIIDIDGNIIGQHKGAFQYTIGQRKGIGVGGGPARFVVDKDVVDNTITVGQEQDLQLYTDTCNIRDWHWIHPIHKRDTLSGEAKIRYRQKNQPVTVRFEEGTIVATFVEQQRAMTPGQVFALYQGEELIGSGIIE